MSSWTYITGTIVVSPMGRTQSEMTYILETVLDHLPYVTGSEKDMDVYIVKKRGYNISSSHNEFGEYGGYRRHNSLATEMQDNYILVVNGSFRDRTFDRTYREFQNWLCRLAKRISVEDVLVEVKGWERSCIITNPKVNKKSSWQTVYGQMLEGPSWHRGNKNGEVNWCEYLMWHNMDNSDYPAILGYKYINDEENDKKVEAWIK